MQLRSFAVILCLCVATFLANEESFAYDKNTNISYTVASNTIHGMSETWREDGDYRSALSCARWNWDDSYAPFCSIWVLEINDPIVGAKSISPLGVSTTKGIDVDSERATVSYDFSPLVHGKWTAQGEHFIQHLVFANHCWYAHWCTGWYLAGIGYDSLGTATTAEHSPIFLDIARYTSVSLSASTVDTTILPFATELLQTYDGPGDVACAISFRRNGAISVFSVGDGAIDSETEQAEVYAVPGRVHVVEEINWCGGEAAPMSTVGCSGSAGIIVERVNAREGLTWAHEYGHNQSLWLLGHPTNPDFLSFGWNVATARRVTQRECNAMRRPLD